MLKLLQTSSVWISESVWLAHCMLLACRQLLGCCAAPWSSLAILGIVGNALISLAHRLYPVLQVVMGLLRSAMVKSGTKWHS